MPELIRIAEEVEATRKPLELRRENKPLAVIKPVGSAGKAKTKADYEAFLSALGSWKDIDAEKLIADIYRWRQEGSRPHTRPE